MSDNYIDFLVTTFKEAYDELTEQYVALFEDAQLEPSLTEMQKIQELQEFLALPPAAQTIAEGRMATKGIDAEGWLLERQRLAERKARR